MSDRDEVLTRVRCSWCGREVAATSRGLDGFYRPRKHGPRAKPCEGSYDDSQADIVSDGHNHRGGLRRR